MSDDESGDGAHDGEEESCDEGIRVNMLYGSRRGKRLFLGGRELSEKSGSGSGSVNSGRLSGRPPRTAIWDGTWGRAAGAGTNRDGNARFLGACLLQEVTSHGGRGDRTGDTGGSDA